MPELLEAYLNRQLQQREAAGALRSLSVRSSGIDFFSNDYLGIATNRVLDKDGRHYAYGATGSRLLSGNSNEAGALEQYLAAYHGAQTALLFNSGYDANLGLITALAHRHTTILYDEYVHASIIDGIRLSHARQAFRFRHNDMHDLEQKLQKYSGTGPLIVIAEAVYSMEGDTAPLEALASLTAGYDAALIVDEAHSTGVTGPKGAGLVAALGLEEQVFARVHTFGKAMGCHGAVVLGSVLLRDYLVNHARSFIYTTALPVQAVMTIRHAYEWLEQNDGVRQQLHDRITFFRKQCKEGPGIRWIHSETAIQGLVLGDNGQARNIAHHLSNHNIKAAAILPPTVPAGTARIRICLHAFNTENDILMLHHTLEQWLQSNPSL
ncbi:aminotransferase class I/II-fold pyridoxal phosphate-dependent enzyme [Taibaiella koreensis]|uniref:aminotransferase class I/II-fold pyridoxal phosphate-dependent enzyme n=1 Tax=Taibaiella koreensis TaxID=1268548 RepID=UPI000E59EE60|nr:8-amino-7-oxononanoate synthase [Taibaiella koreensis]